MQVLNITIAFDKHKISRPMTVSVKQRPLDEICFQRR